MNHLVKILLSTLLLSYLFSPSPIFASQKDKPTVLITGANRGIGLALAKKFSQQGYYVIATARKPGKAVDLKKLGVQIEELDITSQDSVNALKEKIKNTSIDLLINNAGIMGHSSQKFENLNIDKLGQIFEVNSLGALRVIQALLPNLKKGTRNTVVSISSLMGSIQENNSGGIIGYRASKTALNSFNKSLSISFAKQGFTFVVLHPGWVRTDMTSDKATYSTIQSADELYQVISKLDKKDNGKFYDLMGKTIAW